MTPRASILAEANTLIHGERQADYGEPAENFADIAAGWAVIFKNGVTPAKVALAMDWLKTCRAIKTATHRDSYVDGCGYKALAAELAGAE